MAKQKTNQPPDDTSAFREAVKDVQPLRETGKVAPQRAARAPLPVQRLRDEQQALQDSLTDHVPSEAELESGDAVSLLRPGMSPQVLRKLRAGHWAVQDELDLHGLRTEEARDLLAQFLSGANRRGMRCVRVIHGKGYGSKNGTPVLKKRVAAWLAQRGEVLAFCEARPADGGSGAVMVLLRPRGARPEAPEDDREA